MEYITYGALVVSVFLIGYIVGILDAYRIVDRLEKK